MYSLFVYVIADIIQLITNMIIQIIYIEKKVTSTNHEINVKKKHNELCFTGDVEDPLPDMPHC